MSAEIIKISQYKINATIAKCEERLEYLEDEGRISGNQRGISVSEGRDNLLTKVTAMAGPVLGQCSDSQAGLSGPRAIIKYGGRTYFFIEKRDEDQKAHWHESHP